MRRIVLALALLPALFAAPAFAGDAEVKAAQTTIEAQLKAFRAATTTPPTATPRPT